MSQTILTLSNGKGVDLNALRAEDVDLPTFAEHIAKEARYNGATPGLIYFVGQHICHGTDAMLKDGATEEEAAYFHLHDLQEGIWKDDPTPKKVTIATRIQDRCGVLAQDIIDVLDEIVDEHDAAIHHAAGMRWPMPAKIRKYVKLYDLRMFVTEWRDLMNGQPHPNWAPYANIQPLDIKIVPWPWERARDEWMVRARKLLPSLKGER